MYQIFLLKKQGQKWPLFFKNLINGPRRKDNIIFFPCSFHPDSPFLKDDIRCIMYAKTIEKDKDAKQNNDKSND